MGSGCPRPCSAARWGQPAVTTGMDVTPGMSPLGMSPPCGDTHHSTHHHLPKNFTSFLFREGVAMWGWAGTSTTCSNLEDSWSLPA